jgi:hypothetical protein
MLLLCVACLLPASRVFAADDCSLTGKMVYMQLTAIRDIGPTIEGAGTTTPSVAVYIRDRDWEGLTEKERGDLQCYMPELVRVVKSSPGDYLDIPSTAPVYPRMMRNVDSIPANGWRIITGELKSNGLVQFDRTVRAGH